MQYRKEIDGLRALAVLPVIFFHAGFTGFSGGYIGVDIFFVISGYLITSIILKQKTENNFSLAHFYERRIRRIFPALFLVMFACIPFAYLWMLPSNFTEFGQSLVASSTFTSNILFWMQSGYFDNVAETKPLLHTWSLSIEEQYYLLFPLFIVLAWPFGKKFIVGALILVVLVSIGIAEWGWRNHPMANFFLTPMRVWELLAGALLAFYLFKRDIKGNNILSIIGVAMVAYAVYSFDKQTPFPSVYTLIPVIGTVLIILCTTPQTHIGRLLCLKPVVFIGLISYSAYLWHQPLFAFARIRLGEDPSALLYSTLIVVTLGLSYLTWRLVENPIRFKKDLPKRVIFGSGAIATLFMIAVGGYIYKTDGMKGRYAPEDQYLVSLSPATQRAYVPSHFRKFDGKPFAEGEGQKIMIIGDSYAQDFTNALNEVGYFKDKRLSTHTIPSTCGNFLTYEEFLDNVADMLKSRCKNVALNNPKSKRILKDADVIYMAAAWADWVLDYVPQSIENITAITDAKLVIVGRKNLGSIKILDYLKMTEAERLEVENKSSDHNRKINERMKEIVPKEYFFDQQKLICGGDYICPIFTPEGKLISYDGGHLTKDGAKYVGELLIENGF